MRQDSGRLFLGFRVRGFWVSVCVWAYREQTSPFQRLLKTMQEPLKVGNVQIEQSSAGVSKQSSHTSWEDPHDAPMMPFDNYHVFFRVEDRP